MVHDLRIENARVLDGTGAPWFRGSVAISEGTIAAVTRRRDDLPAAEMVVNADGAVVCPGFVDAHSHSDLELFLDPSLEPKVRQGITTEILGQDGFSMAPIYRESGPAEWKQHLAALAGDADVEWSWGGVDDYFDAVEASGVAPNVGTLVGHGTVRFEVLGMSDRAPDNDELGRMAALVTESLEKGALGFSTGLVYPPQVNAPTHEVQTLAAQLEPFGYPFVAHIRSEGRRIWDALDEFIDVGADEEVPVHLSHYKVSGRDQQGKAGRANALIEAARERGVDITAEQYPYTAGNTMLSSVLPPWVHAKGPAAMRDRLDDPAVRERIATEIAEWRLGDWENPAARTGWENIVITNLSSRNEAVEGRSVADLAEERDVGPVDVVCDLLIDEGLGVSMLLHSMSEADVREIMANDHVAVATDGIFGGRPHPRVYGTYPRVLGYYVREENHLHLAEAVRKMTSLPARVMGLETKGLVRAGMDADLVVFDPLAVGSPADFDAPVQFPRGIRHVLVDGEFVVRDEETTGATPGAVLRAGTDEAFPEAT
jgi:N-acyl-D-amino-acid deacylase